MVRRCLAVPSSWGSERPLAAAPMSGPSSPSRGGRHRESTSWFRLAESARIVIADDQTLFRAGLARLLAEDERLTIVGLAADGAEAVQMVAKHLPDVVLMDLKMPGTDGIEATRQ